VNVLRLIKRTLLPLLALLLGAFSVATGRYWLLLIALPVLLLAGAPIPAAQAQPVVVGADQRAGLALTVYEGGFALVHDQRQADLPSGAATIVLSDLSDRLDTTTIRLAAGEGSQIRSLTFERETLSSAALLRRALGKTVRIGRVNPATGEETFDIVGIADGLKPRGDVACRIHRPDGATEEIALLCRIDTADELEYFRHGGILHYVLRGLRQAA